MRNKAMFKAVSIFIALVMMAGLVLTGCGSTDTGNTNESTSSAAASTAADQQTTTKTLEPVTLTWYMDGSPLDDLPKVLEEVNKITKEKLNATINVKIISWDNFDTQMGMIDAAGEAYDLCFTSSWANNYRQAISRGALLSLDDLLKEYGKTILEQVPAKYWDSAKVSGKIYGILNYQTFTGQNGVNIQKELSDKYSFKPEAINKLEDLEPFLETIKKKEPGMYPIGILGGHSIDFTTYATDLQYEGVGPMFDSIMSPAAILHKETGWKVVSMLEQKELMDHFKLLRNWYLKGYIRKDAAALKDFKAEWKTGKYAVTICPNTKPGVEDEQNREFGKEYLVYSTQKPYITTDKIIATMTGISKNSKNPERAMMFYDLMFADKKLYNTFIYGIENEHYKMVSDNVIEVIKPYPQLAWMSGNQFNAYVTTSQSPTVWEDTIKKNEEAEVFRSLGFAFDETPVKNEYAACKAIYLEYYPLLFTGTVDPVKAMPEMISKLKASGLQALLDETQKQIDEWAKANRK